MEKELFIKEMKPYLYLIDENHEATCYLVIGSEKACLIDTMMGYNDLGAAVKKLTDKPVTVVNTHGHPDHIFGNVYFDKAYIHPRDIPMAKEFENEPEFIAECEKHGLSMPPFEEIKGGDVIDLGGKTLTVYEIPGHTPGGILLLLKEDRILFTGDAINHHLWLQIPGALPLEECVAALDNVMFLENEADVILHGHARDYDDISLMRCVRDGIQEICDKKTENDLPYIYFDGLAEGKQHPFKVLPDRKYQQEDHVICYNG